MIILLNMNYTQGGLTSKGDSIKEITFPHVYPKQDYNQMFSHIN